MGRFLDGTLDFPGIARLLEAAVSRYGEGTNQSPDVAAIEAIDTEIRNVYATGAV